MNSEENDLASLDPHLSKDEIDEAELVKTCKHFRQVSCFYTCFFFLFFLLISPFTWGQPALCHFSCAWLDEMCGSCGCNASVVHVVAP